MLTEPGRVVALGDDCVWVETRRASSCGACAARQGCGAGLIARHGARPALVRAWSGESLAAGHCRLGDEVLLALDESAFLVGSFTLYLLPLCALLAGALLAQGAWASDGAAVAGAASGLLCGTVLTRWLARARLHGRRFEPVLLRRLAPGAGGSDLAIPLS